MKARRKGQTRRFRLGRVEKAVLLIARENARDGLPIRPRDVLVHLYGLTPNRPDWRTAKRRVPCFDLRRIDRRRYTSASWAVSLALKRLEAKGLLVRALGLEPRYKYDHHVYVGEARLLPEGENVARFLLEYLHMGDGLQFSPIRAR